MPVIKWLTWITIALIVISVVLTSLCLYWADDLKSISTNAMITNLVCAVISATLMLFVLKQNASNPIYFRQKFWLIFGAVIVSAAMIASVSVNLNTLYSTENVDTTSRNILIALVVCNSLIAIGSIIALSMLDSTLIIKEWDPPDHSDKSALFQSDISFHNSDSFDPSPEYTQVILRPIPSLTKHRWLERADTRSNALDILEIEVSPDDPTDVFALVRTRPEKGPAREGYMKQSEVYRHNPNLPTRIVSQSTMLRTKPTMNESSVIPNYFVEAQENVSQLSPPVQGIDDPSQRFLLVAKVNGQFGYVPEWLFE